MIKIVKLKKKKLCEWQAGQIITEGKIKKVHDFDTKFMRTRTMNKYKLKQKKNQKTE
jgi:hypothetical protein